MLTVAFTAREIRVTHVAVALATVALLAVLTCVAYKSPPGRIAPKNAFAWLNRGLAQARKATRQPTRKAHQRSNVP